MFATDDSFVLVQTVYPIPILRKKSWTIYVIEIRDSFYFSRREQPSLWLRHCTLECEWINILLRTPSVWFLLDRNALRFSLHKAEFVVREIQKTKRSMIVLFFNLLLVASLRSQFSLVDLGQFVFSASALHFLVRWISRLIALWSKGVYIPSLHFFSENNHEPWPAFSRPLANEDLFFLTIMRSYTSENNCSGQWRRKSTGHMYNINGLAWLSFLWLTSFCGTYVSLRMCVV